MGRHPRHHPFPVPSSDAAADVLRTLVLHHLEALGFHVRTDRRGIEWPGNGDKAKVRLLHEMVRRDVLRRHQAWIRVHWPRLASFFADGEDVLPERIRPLLVPVTTSWQHDLFRLARLTWSLPYSPGFGRRLRFLILDGGNRNQEGQPFLIGVLGLQSPPLSFPPRDRLFRYPPGRKTEKVNQTMDIHTLGAVPPYSILLGGKLVALAAASNEVREEYRRRYAGRRTEVEGRLLPPHLVALTTTSAFGRSSLYNRLRYRNEPIAVSLGFTVGYGTFHLKPLYPLLRRFLQQQGVDVRGGLDTGPRREWQICVRALERLGLSKELLRHNVRREVFLFPLIENLREYMEGWEDEPRYRDLPFQDLAAFWRERWLLPRARRVDGWRAWRASSLVERLFLRPADHFPPGRGERTDV